MPTPLQLLEAIPGAHVDSAVFALCQGFAAFRWFDRRAAQGRSIADGAVIQTAVVALATVVSVEWLCPRPEADSAAAYAQCVVTRLTLYLLAGMLNWQLILRRHQRRRAAARLRKHIRTARAAERAHARADAATRAKNGFIASLAHELRTPLNAVIASADAVARGPVTDAQRNQVRRIIKETTQLGKTLNEALELRRIEDYTLTVSSAPIDPVEIAREIVDLFEARAQDKGLQLKLAATVPPALSVSGDGRRFRQVLANLIDNAIKFSTEGVIDVSLAFTPAADAHCLSLLTVNVRDRGVGLTVAQRTALLAGSTSQPTAAGLPASGMGLAIAQKIVRLLGGEITVRSRPGEGSEFGFTIPVTVLSLQAPATHAARPTAQNRRRVLIVDDVAANRIMLQMFLEQQGFAADYAAGGEEAVGLASRNRYDAVLMDLNMPDLDGVTATQRIRAVERREARTVIVAVTATVETEMRAKCFDAGMDGYFIKPLELRRFCADLTDLIAARQTLQAR